MAIMTSSTVTIPPGGTSGNVRGEGGGTEGKERKEERSVGKGVGERERNK